MRIGKTLATLAGLATALGGAGLVGCAAVRLPNVALEVRGPEGAPPVLAGFGADAPVETPQDWSERRAPLLRAAFAEHVYGAFPDAIDPQERSRAVLDEDAFGGLGRIEQIEIGLGAEERRFNLILVTPKAAEGPTPVILVQTFCGNPGTFPRLAGVAPLAHASGCDPRLNPVVKAIFGARILGPDFPAALRRNYAIATFYAGDVVPDEPVAAEPALAALTPAGAAPEQRTGAIAAWAWLYLRAMDVLSRDPRLDPERMTLWGHSRNGKSALLAAAMDERVAAVVALQPGTAGASLQRDGVGESVAAITTSYPHWFAPAYAAFAGREAELPTDQHQLLALIAPRPVLIGAARRDQWSDPHGAFRAAEGATPVYELFGAAGLRQEGQRDPDRTAGLAYYLRGGLHGVHDRDWRETLDFLDAQFAAPRSLLTERRQVSEPTPRAPE